MTLLHHINHVHYRSGAEGTEAGISHVRVTNRVGLIVMPVAEVQRRVDLGDTFETWHTRGRDAPIAEPVQVVMDLDGSAHLHAISSSADTGLVHLPIF